MGPLLAELPCLPEVFLLHSLNDGNVAVVVATARYTLSDLERAVDAAVVGTSQHGQVQGLIVDYSNSDSLPQRKAVDLETIAAFYALRAESYGARLALVAASDVGYGLLRITAAHTDRRGVETMVFRDYSSAIAWAGQRSVQRHPSWRSGVSDASSASG